MSASTVAPKTIGLIVRVSDVKGRDKAGDKFISPELQEATASGYARGRGFTDFKVFTDLNVSHTTPWDERPGASAALAEVEAGLLAGIAVSSQDRLGPLDLTRELKKRLLASEGVLLVPDNPGLEVLGAKGYAKLPGEQMALMHEAQREEIGLRWGSAKHKAFERGVYSGAAPAPLLRNQDGTLYRGPDADRCAAALQHRASGGSWTETARLLHGVGGRAWTPAGAKNWAKSPALKGEQHCPCGCGQTAFRPEWLIVPESVWSAAQARVLPRDENGKVVRAGQRTREQVGRGLLSRLLVGECCGKHLTHEGSWVRGKAYRYYRAKEHGSDCPGHCSISGPVADEFALELVIRYISLSEGHLYVGHEEDPVRRGELERSRDLDRAEVAAYVQNVPATTPGFADGLSIRQASLDASEGALAEHVASLRRPITAQEFLDSWEAAGPEGQHQVFRSTLAQAGILGFNVTSGKAPIEERISPIFDEAVWDGEGRDVSELQLVGEAVSA